MREPLGKGYSRQYEWPDKCESGAIKFGVPSTGLELVSPTTRAKRTQIEWMASFIAKCWKLRNKQKNPCDVNKIKVWSIHEY